MPNEKIIGITGTNITGRLGSGKTLLGVFIVLALKKRFPSYRILSNIHLYGVKYTLITHLHQLVGQDKVIVLLDDIYRWVNAYRPASKLSVLVNTIAGESRKVKQRYIWISARYIGGAHKGLRDLTEVMLVPSYNERTRVLSVRPCMDFGDGRLTQIKPTIRYGPQIVVRLFRYYDTFERVPPIEEK